jgi:hypothetical protein
VSSRRPAFAGPRRAEPGRPIRRPRVPPLLVALAAALAVLHAGTTALDRDRSLSGPSNDVGYVAPGGVRVTVAGSWTRTGDASELAGVAGPPLLSLEGPGTGVRAFVGLLPFTTPSLLPSGFAQSPVAQPAGERVLLGRRLNAYRYRGMRVPGHGGIFDVYAVPTTDGVATVACHAEGFIGWMQNECRRIADTLEIRPGHALPVAPDSAFRARLPVTMRALEDARRSARERLASASPGVAQAGPTAELAQAYGRAAGSLRSLAPTPPSAPSEIVDALTAARGGYAAVAAAVRRGDGSALTAARADVSSLDRRLHRLLRDYAATTD